MSTAAEATSKYLTELIEEAVDQHIDRLVENRKVNPFNSVITWEILSQIVDQSVEGLAKRQLEKVLSTQIADLFHRHLTDAVSQEVNRQSNPA